MSSKTYINSLSLLFVVLLASLPLQHLVQAGLPVTHDGQDHVVRIANFYASLQEGNLIPRWGNNLNWGFGHPVLMFLYPLPSYTASLFHWLGFSLIDSVKLVFVATYILSGVFMYIWIKRHWGVSSGIVSSLLYMYAPYRFVDLSVRGALGEHVAFVFLPLVLLGIDLISEKKRYSMLLFSGSVAGLLLSHNAVSIMMLPVILMYIVIVFWRRTSFSFLFRLLIAGILGCMLSSFFLFPALLEGKYTLRDIVTQGEVLHRFVPFSWFLYSPWNYGGGQEFSKQVGFVQWFFIAAATLFLFLAKNKVYKVYTSLLLILLFGSLWIMTHSSLWVWESVTILQKFQFPWRFLTITVFLSAIIGGVFVSRFSVLWQRRLVLISSIFLLLTTVHMWQPKTFREYTPQFFTDIYKGTTDTGESSPIWSVRFMEFSPNEPVQIAEGKATIQPLERNTTTRTYSIQVSEKAMFVENTLYFPGWTITANGNEVPIEFQNPQWRGRMTFQLDPGIYNVVVSFQETRLRQVANMLTVIGLGIFVVLFFL